VLLVKAAFGFWDIKYSYGAQSFSGVSVSGPCPAAAPASVCSPLAPQYDFTPQRTQDLVLGLTLAVIGVVIALAHAALARGVHGLPGGRPVWVERGSTIAFTALYGLGAIFGLVAGAYAVISYFVVPASAVSPQSNFFATAPGGQPFGELLGTAVLFIPAWVVAAIYLRRRLQASVATPPPVAAAIP
jgi:hypothetical protein